MKNLDFNKLNAKEKLLILKALYEIATNIYKDNSQFVLNQVLKNEENQIKNDFGLFSKRVNKAKTVQDVIDANKKKIEELKEENEKLNAYEDKSVIAKEESIVLIAKYSELANDVALDILQDVIKDFNSKRLEKSASKVAKTK